jgi:DNA-directed RNA polymerase subunit K/omega
MARDQRVYLDDIYASQKCEASVFRAVVMMAKEARFINDQAFRGHIELEQKPTTIAMRKFKEDKLVFVQKDPTAGVAKESILVLSDLTDTD